MSLRRPILKYLPTSEPHPRGPPYREGRVHFPPTPEISATYFVYSARTYDRSAIVVSPNVCTLPQRHCPDRTYVLCEGENETHLLKSVEPEEIQDDEEAIAETVGTEYDQDVARTDYFSIPALSATQEMMAYPGSDVCDRLISSSKDTNCGLQSVPVLDVSVHNINTHKASAPHEHTQSAFVILPLAPPLVCKRNFPLRDRDMPDRLCSVAGANESGHPPLARSRRSRRASSFSSDVPPDSGCLGGF